MCGIEPYHVSFGAPPAMNVTTPESFVFRWLYKSTQRKDGFGFHIHQVNFLFPHSPAWISISDHPFLIGRKCTVSVIIKQTVSKSFIVFLSYGKQNMGILFPFIVGGYHELVIIQPVEMRTSPFFRETSLQVCAV